MGNEVSSPDCSTNCSVHTANAPHPQCWQCNSTHLSALTDNRTPAVDLTGTCPFHTTGTPHPYCVECNDRLPHRFSSTARSSLSTSSGQCQVHTTTNTYCQRCTGFPYTVLRPGLSSSAEALQRCSLHAALAAPHPLCDQCNEANRIASPAPPLDDSTLAIRVCNAHSQQNPNSQCRTCNSAAFREHILARVSRGEPDMDIGLGRCNMHNADAPDLHCRRCNEATVDEFTTGITTPTNGRRRCNRHDDNTPNMNCQTCNDALYDFLMSSTDVQETPPSSPERRRCHRHDNNAPNPNCVTCNVDAAQNSSPPRPLTLTIRCNRHDVTAPNPNCQTCNAARLQSAPRVSLDDAPPPAYHNVQADRVIASSVFPYPTIRAPSYTAASGFVELPTHRMVHAAGTPTY